MRRKKNKWQSLRWNGQIFSRWFPFTVASVVSGLLAVQTFILPQGWPRCQRLQQELNRATREKERRTQHIQAMQHKIEQFRNRPQMMEHFIRDELGWVKPDELILHIEP
jgi:cell division protein FtsB